MIAGLILSSIGIDGILTCIAFGLPLTSAGVAQSVFSDGTGPTGWLWVPMICGLLCTISSFIGLRTRSHHDMNENKLTLMSLGFTPHKGCVTFQDGVSPVACGVYLTASLFLCYSLAINQIALVTVGKDNSAIFSIPLGSYLTLDVLNLIKHDNSSKNNVLLSSAWDMSDRNTSRTNEKNHFSPFIHTNVKLEFGSELMRSISFERQEGFLNIMQQPSSPLNDKPRQLLSNLEEKQNEEDENLTSRERHLAVSLPPSSPHLFHAHLKDKTICEWGDGLCWQWSAHDFFRFLDDFASNFNRDRQEMLNNDNQHHQPASTFLSSSPNLGRRHPSYSISDVRLKRTSPGVQVRVLNDTSFTNSEVLVFEWAVQDSYTLIDRLPPVASPPFAPLSADGEEKQPLSSQLTSDETSSPSRQLPAEAEDCQWGERMQPTRVLHQEDLSRLPNTYEYILQKKKKKQKKKEKENSSDEVDDSWSSEVEDEKEKEEEDDEEEFDSRLVSTIGDLKKFRLLASAIIQSLQQLDIWNVWCYLISALCLVSALLISSFCLCVRMLEAKRLSTFPQNESDRGVDMNTNPFTYERVSREARHNQVIGRVSEGSWDFRGGGANREMRDQIDDDFDGFLGFLKWKCEVLSDLLVDILPDYAITKRCLIVLSSVCMLSQTLLIIVTRIYLAAIIKSFQHNDGAKMSDFDIRVWQGASSTFSLATFVCTIVSIVLIATERFKGGNASLRIIIDAKHRLKFRS
eukprot:GDKJ01063542.1.p1 GENE.GDKJ01063542.1~~GDKJ01063542.1.p1  ORF type:complete len:743 (-),score=174.51 GDKJ01063542.1:39-2267(-)